MKRSRFVSVKSATDQLYRTVDDLLFWIDCPDSKGVANPQWEVKMLQRLEEVFDIAIDVRSKFPHVGLPENELYRMRAEAMGLVQILHANPKLRLEVWSDHSPRNLAKLRKLVALLEGENELLQGDTKTIVVKAPEPLRVESERIAEESRTDKPKTTTELKSERGDWMLDHCDPSQLTNLDLQATVNKEAPEHGWPLFDSGTGNGAFDAYKTAFLKRNKVPFRRDDRGKTK